jgi:hypothetical protein
MVLPSLNKYSARAFASSTLPTPVVPKKRKDPTGFFFDLAILRDFYVPHHHGNDEFLF